MKMLSKYATAPAIAGTLAFVAATPSQARWGGHHNGAAAAIGFGAGALVGAAAASAVYPGYYDYGPDYAYATGYDSYAYEPAPAYYYRHYRGGNTPACATDLGYGRIDYSSC
jgi:hypothetical protein